MNFSFVKYLLFLPAVTICNISCSSSSNMFHGLIDKATGYNNEFPYQNTSEDLEKIGSTIYRINSIAFYQSYVFDDSSRYIISELSDSVIQKKSVKSIVINRTAFGTGTMIYSKGGTIGILTCAHVVNFPDTIITYFAKANGIFTNYVQSISFKTKEKVYVAGLPEGSDVDVVLSNDDIDVALLGKKYGIKYSDSFSPFSYGFGNAKELKWGTFVYLLGYPLNYKMVTRAIVSSPNYDNKGSFLIDASVNRGFSGGIILALRNSVPNFEFVGIVDWVPEENQSILEPAPIGYSRRYSPLVPYKGEIFVKQLSYMQYGIARAISIEQIKEYFAKNILALTDYGFDNSILH